MVADLKSYETVREEARRLETRAEAIIQSALANASLMAMWERSNRMAEEEGTDNWPTLEELKREYGVSS